MLKYSSMNFKHKIQSLEMISNCLVDEEQDTTSSFISRNVFSKVFYKRTDNDNNNESNNIDEATETKRYNNIDESKETATSKKVNGPKRGSSIFSFDPFRKLSKPIPEQFFETLKKGKYNIFLQFTAPHLVKKQAVIEFNKFKRLDINLFFTLFVSFLILIYVSNKCCLIYVVQIFNFS